MAHAIAVCGVRLVCTRLCLCLCCRLTAQAQKGEDVEFTSDLLKGEIRPELMQFLHDTYSRMTDGESDPVDDLQELVKAVNTDTNHRFNSLVRLPAASSLTLHQPFLPSFLPPGLLLLPRPIGNPAPAAWHALNHGAGCASQEAQMKRQIEESERRILAALGSKGNDNEM